MELMRQVKVYMREEVNLCGDTIRTVYYLKKRCMILGFIPYYSTIVDGYAESTKLFDSREDILKFLKETTDSFNDELVEEINCETLSNP